MRGLVVLFSALCLFVPACGEVPQGGADAPGPGVVAGLEAHLVAEPVDDRGRYALPVPFDGPIRLALRITNVGEVPMQVPRSSFPFHYFYKLEIERVAADGMRVSVPCSGDLYPMNDMVMPKLEYVTLEPGASTERDMAVLVREGYGKVLEPGTYEVRGLYAPKPTFLDGRAHEFFSDKVGRDAALPLWPGPVVKSPILTMRVTRD